MRLRPTETLDGVARERDNPYPCQPTIQFQPLSRLLWGWARNPGGLDRHEGRESSLEGPREGGLHVKLVTVCHLHKMNTPAPVALLPTWP